MRLLTLAGFLGSGKTTLLLALLDALEVSGRDKVVVIENEASAQGVDDQYLVEQGLQVRRIHGGCICCGLRDSLFRTLHQVVEVFRPEVVIIEPSGVAQPGDVAAVVEESGLPFERVDLVVLLDAERFDQIHAVCGPFIDRSIISADVVAINKIDAVSPARLAEIEARVEEIRRDATVVPISARERTNIALLLESLEPREGRGEPRPATTAEERGPGQTTVTRRYDLTFDPPLTPDDVIGRVCATHCWLCGAVEQRAGSAVGHVKSLLTSNGDGRVLVRTTSAERGPHVEGELSGPVARLEHTLNAIVFGVAQPEFEVWVDEELARQGLTPG